MIKNYRFFVNSDKAALGFLEAIELATFAEISKARAGLFNTFFAILLDIICLFFSKYLKKLLNRSAIIALPLTVIVFYITN